MTCLIGLDPPAQGIAPRPPGTASGERVVSATGVAAAAGAGRAWLLCGVAPTAVAPPTVSAAAAMSAVTEVLKTILPTPKWLGETVTPAYLPSRDWTETNPARIRVSRAEKRQASRAGDPLTGPRRRCGALGGGRCLGVARPEPQIGATVWRVLPRARLLGRRYGRVLIP